jgi:peptidoglycan/xylan/chitin deacetylase (PgdA/CDA1 family)
MNKIPIFYYHSIGGIPPETLHTDKFKRHLDALEKQSFKTIRFCDLLMKRYDPNEKNVVLTFDDGLLDNYRNVLPLLATYGFTATFFIIPGFFNITRWVNPRTRHWSDTKKKGFTIPFSNMNASHLKELIKMNMEIGCHSYTHPSLTKITPNLYEYQIIESKHKLEDELGVPIYTFCYPKGRYNKNILKVVQKAGYLGATTTIPGYFNPDKSLFKCNRFLVENPFFFESVLNGKGLSLIAYIKSVIKAFGSRQV